MADEVHGRKKSAGVSAEAALPALVGKYRPTETETKELARFNDLQREASPGLKVTVKDKKSVTEIKHPDQRIGLALLSADLGGADADFISGILNQLNQSQLLGLVPDELNLNFILSFIANNKPKNTLEALLLKQAAFVHLLINRYTNRLVTAQSMLEQEHAERMLLKLMRTYQEQMASLKRNRSSGEQKVTVQHVTVSDGGQAIVGNVSQAKKIKKPERPSRRTKEKGKEPQANKETVASKLRIAG